jgi:hypothetical protein
MQEKAVVNTGRDIIINRTGKKSSNHFSYNSMMYHIPAWYSYTVLVRM